MNGFVYLIGAGCGRYDLITLRGLNVLKKCDVIVYDALIDTQLLDYAPDDAELICVGKRSGKHSAVQAEINAILTEKALSGHIVGRLKGGDPFVFGRGGEEISELQKFDIGYEVIPGISSCIAVPELSGIPVTHRKLSRSFHVITAHTADSRQDFSQYAVLDGTLIFLMGLNALDDISAGLISGGKPSRTPAAVISNGCTDSQKTVRGTLDNISGLVKRAKISAPAVIVVGDTAAFELLHTADNKEMSGISVTVTGTRKFTKKVGELLENEGSKVRRYSHIRITPKGSIPSLGGYECIAFTSSYGAGIFIEHCRKNRIQFSKLAGIKIAAVGSGTAKTLADAGLHTNIIPDRYTVGELAERIADSVKGRVLVLRSELGSPDLNRVFYERCISFDDVKIYDTSNRGLPSVNADTDYIVFGSSSGVQGFFESGCTLSGHTVIVCIGAQTKETVRKYTHNRIITAYPHSASGIAAAIKGDIKR